MSLSHRYQKPWILKYLINGIGVSYYSYILMYALKSPSFLIITDTMSNIMARGPSVIAPVFNAKMQKAEAGGSLRA